MPIGDYVHLHAASIEQGSASVALNDLKTKMLSSVSKGAVNQKELANLGNELSKMKDLLQNSGNDASSSGGKIANAIMEFIEDSAQAAISSIDWSTGRANIKKNSAKGVGQIRGNTTWSEAQRAQDALNRFSKLYQQTMQATEGGTLTLKTLRDVVSAARQAREDLTDVAKISLARLDALNLRYGQRDMAALKTAITMLNNNQYNPRDKNIQLLIRTINDSIRLLAPIHAYQLAQGNLFEAMLSALNYTQEGYVNKTYQELSQMVMAGVKGGGRATVAYRTDRFNKNVADRLFSRSIGDFSLMANASPTQGKVDVVIQANSNSNVGNSVDLRISAKNVNLKLSHGWIHVVSGTSLLALLQDENDNYVNHYINIFAQHPDRDADAKLNEMRQAYTKLTNFLIAIKALTGEVTRISQSGSLVNDSANVFVVNDSSTGQFHIYSMASIKQKLMEKYINSTSGELSGGRNVISVKYSQSRFKNEFVEGDPDSAKWIRVSNVLSDVHATKVSASINISIMDLMRA